MVDKARNKGDQCIRCKLEQWKKVVNFGILYNISDSVTLVKLMNSLGNVNHAVSVVGRWIFIRLA